MIIRWVDQLPDDVDADLRAKAEATCSTQAQHHDAKALNQLGKHLFEVIAPDEADAREAEILEAEEAAAGRRSCFTGLRRRPRPGPRPVRHPDPHRAALKKILLAITAPKHQAATQGAGVERRPPRKRWDRRSAS